ncbi:PQQ-dependent sugar dehydrogenase [Luteolibacter flavescens]|uniref:PQQ-dependent sugar dehydrogenase n=1 Tax=Luteolibacter flavescens TaxID=1859460 RepID=A0ABT3FRX6_9BACT|nr:PQQ-dependent sugar dehydrogenase [Luteolibacter flavescens]MCW1885949.1 PQQ-dependent sugar dehydrogenase [Luteolibacter flavescens]
MKASLAASLVLALSLHAEEAKEPATITGSVNRPPLVPASEERMASLKVADGFTVTVFAKDLGKPRMMAVSPEGRVYVTRRGEDGDVIMLQDKDGDGLAEEPITVLKLPHVHGIAIREGIAYLAAIREVHTAQIREDGTFGPLQKLYTDLPDAGQHPNRTIGFGPSGSLYLSVGSTCNAAPEPNPESATMLELQTDGKGRRIHATGLRNTIGFAWHPETLRMYGVDHGIDWLGDDSQGEELNEIKSGKNYGWPFVFENGKPNPARDPKEDIGKTWEAYAKECEPSLMTLDAHSAPMAMIFPSAKQFPEDFHGDALVTLHGSWNRSEPSGYKVVRLRFKNGEPQAFEDFVTGFYLEGDKAHFARPCGLAEWTDGTILMSDDSGGVIYRIWHSKDALKEEPGSD